MACLRVAASAAAEEMEAALLPQADGPPLSPCSRGTFLRLPAESEVCDVEAPPRSPTNRSNSSAATATVATLCFVALGVAAARLLGLRGPDFLEQSPVQKNLVSRRSDVWQCHRYSGAQGNDWCKSAGTKGGYEYKFVGGDGSEAGLCGKCWCCRQEVIVTAKKENKSAPQEPTPPACENPVGFQEDCSVSRCCDTGFYCSRQHFAVRDRDGLSPQSQWFCSMQKDKGDVLLEEDREFTKEKKEDEEEKKKEENTKEKEKQKEKDSEDKKRKEEKEQAMEKRRKEKAAKEKRHQGVAKDTTNNEDNEVSDAMAALNASSHSQEAKEAAAIAIAAAMNAEAAKEKRHQGAAKDTKAASSAHNRTKEPHDKPHEKRKPHEKASRESGGDGWKCHRYVGDQGNPWCKAAGNQSGFEYRFVGPDSDLCGDCWCCERERTFSKAHQNCQQTQGCEQAGFQCYERNASWAECKSTCTEDGWSCKELGKRTSSGVSEDGAAARQICAIVGKCLQKGHQCYQQNDYYSACRLQCDDKDWSCKKYGDRTPASSDPTHPMCAWGVDTSAPCEAFGCCAAEGLQCYSRDDTWSNCMSSCQHTMDLGSGLETWSCEEHGPRTKVELGCTWLSEECTATKRCCSVGFSCVQKDAHSAFCTFLPEDVAADGWEGTILGRSQSEWQVTPVPAGSTDESGTSLFCFMAVLPGSHEDGLRWMAQSKRASIFACDEYDVFRSWQSTLQSARGEAGEIEDNEAWSSIINTDVFFDVWEQVFNGGRYKSHDWTVKVDPDAVFFPSRLRHKLGNLHAPRDQPIYIKNTKKDSGFFGACEVLSAEAVKKYSRYYKECFAAVPTTSGEDASLKSCMDMIGAGYMLELDVLRKTYNGGPCTDPERVTFHPRKNLGSWESCYNEAMR